MYKNFLLLHCAMYCLLSAQLCNVYYDRAEQCFIVFVKHCSELYGASFLFYNEHSLIHVSDDARLFGSLDNVSSFPSENYMQQSNKMLRKKHKPLQQVVKQRSERDLSNAYCKHVMLNGVHLVCTKEHFSGPTLKDLECGQ
jgi:hypothetical protein